MRCEGGWGEGQGVIPSIPLLGHFLQIYSVLRCLLYLWGEVLMPFYLQYQILLSDSTGHWEMFSSRLFCV